MEKGVVSVVSTTAAVACFVIFYRTWLRGRAGDRTLKARARNVGDYIDYGKKNQWEVFSASIQNFLQRFGQTQQKTLQEKKVLESVQTLKQLADCRADSEEILRARIFMLNECVKFDEKHPDEVVFFTEEANKLRREKFRRDMEAEIDIKIDRKINEEFQKQVTNTKQNMEEEFDKKLEEWRREVERDFRNKIGLLILESARQMRFIRCGEWNSLFQRLVAWKVGATLFLMLQERKAKAEGKNWEGDMHKKVKKVLNESFGLKMPEDEDLWHLSIAFHETSSSFGCYEINVRQVHGAELKTAIAAELDLLEQNGREALSEFEERFHRLMREILTILKANVVEIEKMKQEHEAQAPVQARLTLG